MFWRRRDKDRRGASSPGPRPHRRSLLRDRRGVTALEFAIVGPPALLLCVFLTEASYDFYAQEALDYAVATAARQVQIGNAQAIATATQFMSQILCPAVGTLLPCTNIAVNVQEIATNYYVNGSATVPTDAQGHLSTGGYGFCPGGPGQLMLVQAVYSGPSIVAGFVPGMAISNGSTFVHATLSTAAFINENFPITSAQPAGC